MKNEEMVDFGAKNTEFPSSCKVPMDKYIVEKKIGKGSYGSVYVAQSKETKKRYVLKRIPLANMSTKEKKAGLAAYEVGANRTLIFHSKARSNASSNTPTSAYCCL